MGFPLRASLAAASVPASPRPAAAQGPEPCILDPAAVPPRPVRFDGTVVGTIPHGQVGAINERVERETGARISPDHADLPRVVVEVVMDRRTFRTVAAVVDGRIPGLGDHVDVISRHRDPRARCGFIPWTVAAPAAVSRMGPPQAGPG